MLFIILASSYKLIINVYLSDSDTELASLP